MIHKLVYCFIHRICAKILPVYGLNWPMQPTNCLNCKHSVHLSLVCCIYATFPIQVCFIDCKRCAMHRMNSHCHVAMSHYRLSMVIIRVRDTTQNWCHHLQPIAVRSVRIQVMADASMNTLPHSMIHISTMILIFSRKNIIFKLSNRWKRFIDSFFLYSLKLRHVCSRSTSRMMNDDK